MNNSSASYNEPKALENNNSSNMNYNKVSNMQNSKTIKALKFAIANIIDDETLPYFVYKKKTILRYLLLALDNVCRDFEKYDIVLIKIRPLQDIGWSQIQSIRRQILKISKLIPSVAFIERAGLKEYYLACACNEIFLTPSATLDIIGIQAEVYFLKDSLEHIGVGADFVSTGPYKTFADSLTRSSMSDEHRTMLKSILKNYLDEISKDISNARPSITKPFNELIHDGPFTAHEALEARLVDKLIYQENIDSYLKERFNKSKVKDIPINLPKRKKCILKASKRVAILYAQGNILDGSSQKEARYDTITQNSFLRSLKKIRKNKRIKALVIRINSPGGSAITSDIIWNAVRKTSEEKPVIVSMANVVASGGYYIAVAATEIFAESMTITGSIGVVSGKLYFSKLLDKLSVKRDTVSLGDNSDIYSPFSPFTEQQKQKLTKHTFDFYYKTFLEKVSQGRNQDIQTIEQFAQGRVFTGGDALSYKLIDKQGGLLEALEAAKQHANIPSDDKVNYVIYPKRKFSLSYMFSDTFAGNALTLKHKTISMIGNYISLSKHNALYIMPWDIKIDDFN